MFITFSDGHEGEAVIYSTDPMLRVALRGADDLLGFACIRGQWVSENCEPVRIDFAWERFEPQAIPAEAECICPKELADELIKYLYSDSEIYVEAASGNSAISL